MWIDKKQMDSIVAYQRTLDKRFLFMGLSAIDIHMRRRKSKFNPKWAYIQVGNTRIRAFVSEDQQIAYKEENYSPTQMQWKKFTFLRWLRFMDV